MGSLETSLARPMSRSVTPPMAETTPTTWLPWRADSRSRACDIADPFGIADGGAAVFLDDEGQGGKVGETRTLEETAVIARKGDGKNPSQGVPTRGKPAALPAGRRGRKRAYWLATRVMAARRRSTASMTAWWSSVPSVDTQRAASRSAPFRSMTAITLMRRSCIRPA